MADENRPAKRIKIDADRSDQSQDATTRNGGTADVESAQHKQHVEGSQPQGEEHHKSASSKKRKNGRKAHGGAETKNRQSSIRTFSQPSVMCVGDKGIFVTCDKGSEKKTLLELHDIVQDYLELRGIDASGESTREGLPEAEMSTVKVASSNEDIYGGIEADIASELAGMRDNAQQDADVKSPLVSKPMQMITLDIPCVSFLRLPPKSSLDPVEIVHRICLEAAKPNSKQRSRYVRRLTPISYLAKTLKQGLETVSEEVLPHHFGPDENGDVRSVKFAIRPTVRENEQLDRDLIIKPVASRVQEMGKDSHKVDLKNYDKAVIVEVYRGWIGMCVVDNTSTSGYEQGYEQLKRFNLAEIYSGR